MVGRDGEYCRVHAESFCTGDTGLCVCVKWCAWCLLDEHAPPYIILYNTYM